MIFAGVDYEESEVTSEYPESEINPNGWVCVTSNTSGEQHVCPTFDFKNHTINLKCWCVPFVDDGIIVHNSMDGREKVESGEVLRQ